MATAARLPIVADRVGSCVRTIEFVGVDLTGVDLRMQVRLRPDTPGAPQIDLQSVSNANSEGVRLVSVATVGGVTTSVVRLRINESTMKDGAKVPYAGEPGTASVLSYDLIGVFGNDKRRLAYGEFVAVPTTYGSDNAPSVLADGSGTTARDYAAWTSATLTFAGDVTKVTVNGVEIVADLVRGAELARDTAQLWAEGSTAPGGTGTRSSKSWASASSLSATASEAAKSLALQYRDSTIQTATTAQAAFLTLGQLYQTISSGLAATAPNAYFAVAGTGDVFATVYQKVSGSAVLVNTLASQAALDRVGRFVPNIANIDNSVAINAALAEPLVAGVILPPGDIRVDHAIVMNAAMPGKFVRGSGEGVTRLIRTNNISGSAYADKAGVYLDNARGALVSDLTFVSPKVADKVQAVWCVGTNARDFLVQRVEALNCGYSFWAQDGAGGVFSQCRSRNGNVHFEATAASDVTFEYCNSDDGDGDNPLVCEGVWHTLLGSQRIRFLHNRHIGKGVPFLFITNGGPNNFEFMDDIYAQDCYAQTTDGKLGIEVSSLGGTMGRITLDDCGVRHLGAVPGTATGGINTGQVVFNGGRWQNSNADGLAVAAGARFTSNGTRWDCDRAADAGSPTGAFAGEGRVRLNGIEFNTISPYMAIGGGPDFYLSEDSLVNQPTQPRFMPPISGKVTKYVTKTDVVATNGNGLVDGATTLAMALTLGEIYRITFRGTMRNANGTADQAFVLMDGLGGTYLAGGIKLQTSPSAFVEKPLGAVGPYTGAAANYTGASAKFEMDITIRGDGGSLSFTGFNTMTILAGAEFTAERLA